MSIDKLLHGLAESLKDEMPATGETAWAFTEACRRADNDPRERRRISDIADLLDAEEALYAEAVAALERGDQHTALPLLRQCAEAGTGEAHWLLAQLLEDLGHTGEAITWYQHAADDGDPRAAEKLTELPAINPNDEDGVIGYRRTGDNPRPGEHGTRRASRSNRRPVARRAVPAIGRFAITAAAAAAAAVIGFGLGTSRSVLPVPLPAISTAGLATSMPNALLFFTSASAELTPSADVLLRPLVQWARSQHLAVSITGYASPGGSSDAYDLALSLRRAAAVRDRLIALGLPSDQITHVTGDGARRQSLNACRLDKTRCVDLNRVVVVLSPEAP